MSDQNDHFTTREVRLLKRVRKYAEKVGVSFKVLAVTKDVQHIRQDMNRDKNSFAALLVCPICAAANDKLQKIEFETAALAAKRRANLDISEAGVYRIIRAADSATDPLRSQLLELLGVSEQDYHEDEQVM